MPPLNRRSAAGWAILVLFAACVTPRAEPDSTAFASRAAPPACEPARVKHLDGVVFVEPERGRLRGQFGFVGDCIGTRLSLRLDERFDVEEIRVDGVRQRFTRNGVLVEVSDLRPKAAPVQVEMFYAGVVRSREMEDLLVSDDFVTLTSSVAWYPLPQSARSFSSTLRVFAPRDFRFVSRGAKGPSLGATRKGGGAPMKEVLFEDARAGSGLSLYGGPHLRSKTATIAQGTLELFYTTLSVRDRERLVADLRDAAERVAPSFEGALLVVFVPGRSPARIDGGLVVAPEDSLRNDAFVRRVQRLAVGILKRE